MKSLVQRFDVVYFDRRVQPKNYHSKSAKFREALFDKGQIVPNIINFNKTSQLKIDPTSLTQYKGVDGDTILGWLGELNVDYDGEIEININWDNGSRKSNIRLLIDGFHVYEGGRTDKIFCKLSKGRHRIELGYVSRQTSTELLVSFSAVRKVFKYEQLEKTIKLKSDINVWYFGVNQVRGSSNAKRIIDIVLEESSKPVVILLRTSDMVHWSIKNPHNTEIKAVILGAYNPFPCGGDLVTGLNGNIPVYYSNIYLGGAMNLNKAPESFLGHPVTRSLYLKGFKKWE